MAPSILRIEITVCFPKRDEYPNLIAKVSQEATCTIASLLECESFILPTGPPDPPSDLDYNDGVVIESSVDLQWTRPSYTGGVALTYNVSANGETVMVEDDRERVEYSPGLVYGEVHVSAINTCGLENQQPATINIPVAGLYSTLKIIIMGFTSI